MSRFLFRLIVLLATLALTTTPRMSFGQTADAGFAARALIHCETDLRWLNPVSGWQVRWPLEWRGGTVDPSVLEGHVRAIDDAIKHLRQQVRHASQAPRPVVQRVLIQVDGLHQQLLGQSQPWVDDLDSAVAPAVERYRDFLKTEYLPHAPFHPALGKTPECFLAAVKWWTSRELTINAITRAGERLLESAHDDLLSTYPAGTSIDEVLAKLRRPSTTGLTASQLIGISEAAVARAQDIVGEWFLPRSFGPIDVEPMMAHLQASYPAGYYAAGSPARYVINTSYPAKRRLMAEVITFHETIPGHHLSNTYPGSGAGFNSGFIEGWAIYAEYLADEMNLYSTLADRRGMMAKHAWAATRLIIEPGLQSGGWSRAKAIEFMTENTAMVADEVALEVDRYIAMPGQSLAYMLGYDAISGARDAAESALGEAFDIRQFHDIVLKPGPRSLGEMEADVKRWVSEVGGS